MKRYEKYKESGVEWIGEIPEHWELKKISYGFDRIGSGTTPSTGNHDYYRDGIFHWLQTGDLTNGEINSTSKMITKKALDDYSILRFFKPNSLVIAMYGATIGKTGITKIETTTNQACCVLSKPNSFITKFVFHWFNANKNNIISLGYGGGQPNISQEIIKSLRIPYPPITEQIAIANYLDKKTTQIDKLVSSKQKLIDLLIEERTAIINHAVTKGIDPNIKLKPIGIEWLGDIPEHWEVKRFKYWFDLVTIKSGDQENKIGLENIESKTGRFITTDSQFEGEGVDFELNDILFGKLRPYLAKVYLADFNGSAVGDFFIFRGKESIYPKFAAFRMLNYSFIEIINSSTYGAKMPRVSWEFISNLPIAFPNREEQIVIGNHIKTQNQRIEGTITRIEKEIELLQEYRTALISEVVTGKIKVI